MTFACAMAIGALVAPTPAAAQRYIYETKYCAREYDGAIDCAYYTLWQCRMAVSGTGGDCAVNPRYGLYPARGYRKPPRGLR